MRTSLVGRLSRRGLLGGLAMLPALARGARAGPQPITVVCPTMSEVHSLDLLNAKAGGHFAAHGLDATVINSGSGISGMQQLVAGRCQFMRNAGMDLIKATAAQSVPVLSIGMFEHAITFVMVSSADRPIRDPALLQGKKVGVFAVGSTTDDYLDLLLHRAGLPHDAAERQPVGANPATFALVRNGRLDAIILSYESAWPLLHPAQDAVAMRISDFVTMPGRCYLTTRKMVDETPALALAFTQAIAASMLEIIAGPIEPLIARTMAAFDLPVVRSMADSVAIASWAAQVWMANGRAELLRNSGADWQAAVAEMAAAGLGTVPSADTLYTNRFVEQALPG